MVWHWGVHPQYRPMMEAHAHAWADVLGAHYGGEARRNSPFSQTPRHLIIGALAKEAVIPARNVTVWFPEQPNRSLATAMGMAAQGARVLTCYADYPGQHRNISFFPAYYHSSFVAPRNGEAKMPLYFCGWPTERREQMLAGIVGQPWFRWDKESVPYPHYLIRLGQARCGLVVGSWEEPIFYPVRVVCELLANGVTPLIERRYMKGAYEDLLPYLVPFDSISDLEYLAHDRTIDQIGRAGQEHVRRRYDLRHLVETLKPLG